MNWIYVLSRQQYQRPNRTEQVWLFLVDVDMNMYGHTSKAVYIVFVYIKEHFLPLAYESFYELNNPHNEYYICKRWKDMILINDLLCTYTELYPGKKISVLLFRLGKGAIYFLANFSQCSMYLRNIHRLKEVHRVENIEKAITSG